MIIRTSYLHRDVARGGRQCTPLYDSTRMWVLIVLFSVAWFFATVPAYAHPLDEILNGFGQTGVTIQTSIEFLWLGFTHIVPKGLDHILFVLGLFFLNTRLAPLLWQVTAFTLAHTITLAFSILGAWQAPAFVVEPIIALSIAFIAFENVMSGELKPWRPVVVFVFGLIHGLGFAGVLQELGLPEGAELLALINFNIGVEIGQIAVIAAAFLGLWLFRRESWYRARIAVPASMAIGLVGLYWFFERVGVIAWA